MEAESTEFATAQESTPKTVTPSNEDSAEEPTGQPITAPNSEEIDELLTRLRNEPVRAEDYGKTEISKSDLDTRPKRAGV